jgi:hypothetical protein
LSQISNLIKKGVKFLWFKDCDMSSQTRKEILGRKITLAYPNFQEPFDIHTDASHLQLGAVINQLGK